MEKQKRLTYIDIAKGLLILLVILYHVSPFMKSSLEGAYVIPIIGKNINKWFDVFFMPAFFIISGFCSNFSIDWKTFFIKQVKTIVLPVFLLTYILYAITLYYFNPVHALGAFWLHGNWFILSLLFSRTIFYFLLHTIKNKKIILACSLLMTFLTVYLHTQEHSPNPFYIHQGLIAVSFIAFGNFIKEFNLKNKFMYGSAILYIFSIIVINALNLDRPVWVMYFNFKTHYIPLFYFLAITGTATILVISKHIKPFFLPFCGKNSLIIYLTHSIILPKVIKSFFSLKPSALPSDSVFSFFIIFVITTLFSLFVCKLFDNKYGNFILGKF